jgi:hypothetical protein
MNLCNILRSFLNLKKRIEKKELPSQGLFYKDDMDIKIKRASDDDISKYEEDFIKDNLSLIIKKVKKIVENNIILSNGYIFEDIKSIDVVFLFLEIVKFTKNDVISLDYTDVLGKNEKIEFNSKSFNYYNIGEEIMSNYNNDYKYFEINGYKYSLPSIGIENCLTQFLLNISGNIGSGKYNKYSYDFTYFLSDKNFLGFDEIDNLIDIFNFDINDDEKLKIKKVIKIFIPLQKYSLIKDGIEIEINSKIDLKNIWK